MLGLCRFSYYAGASLLRVDVCTETGHAHALARERIRAATRVLITCGSGCVTDSKATSDSHAPSIQSRWMNSRSRGGRVGACTPQQWFVQGNPHALRATPTHYHQLRC
jgi:hypothetical protein